MLEIEPKVSNMLGKSSTTELGPWLLCIHYDGAVHLTLNVLVVKEKEKHELLQFPNTGPARCLRSKGACGRA